MKILLDARMTGTGSMHGIARYLDELLRRFPVLAPDLRFQLIVPRGHRSPYGYPTVPARFRPFHPAEQLELPYLIARQSPDLVHFPSIALAYSGRCPSLVTVHDLIPLIMERSLKSEFYRRLILGPGVRRARHVLVVSRHSQEDAVRMLGLRPENVTVGYNGVNPRPEVCAEPDLLQRYGVRPPFLLCITNPRPHKNAAFLLRAFAGLDLPLQLVLVSGSSPVLESEMARDPRVLRLQGLPEAHLQRLLRDAWALVMPSLYEGFGLPVAEALVHGTPTLAARAASLPEVVGEAGLLFDPRDEESLREQLRRLWGDERLYADLRAASPVQARRFDWDELARTHVRLYRSLMGRPSRSGSI